MHITHQLGNSTQAHQSRQIERWAAATQPSHRRIPTRKNTPRQKTTFASGSQAPGKPRLMHPIPPITDCTRLHPTAPDCTQRPACGSAVRSIQALMASRGSSRSFFLNFRSTVSSTDGAAGKATACEVKRGPDLFGGKQGGCSWYSWYSWLLCQVKGLRDA